jgi:hypothetical protein
VRFAVARDAACRAAANTTDSGCASDDTSCGVRCGVLLRFAGVPISKWATSVSSSAISACIDDVPLSDCSLAVVETECGRETLQIIA